MSFLDSLHRVENVQRYLKTIANPQYSLLVLLLLIMMEYVSLIIGNCMDLTDIFLGKVDSEIVLLHFGKC